MQPALALPVETSDGLLPTDVRKRVRDAFAIPNLLRERAPFAALDGVVWHVWLTIAGFWRDNAECWPSQERIGRLAGCSVKTVQRAVTTLRLLGLLRVREERRDGHRKLFYAPGATAAAELVAFVEGAPAPRAKTLSPAKATGHHDRWPPVTMTDEPVTTETNNPSSSRTSYPPPPPPSSPRVKEEQGIDRSVTDEERGLADEVLRARVERAYPGRAVRMLPSAVEVALVVGIVRSLSGDVDAKREALADALAGAWLTSKLGAPRVAFVFGHVEYFEAHRANGRRRRLAEALRARATSGASSGAVRGSSAPPAESIATPAEIAALVARMNLGGGAS